MKTIFNEALLKKIFAIILVFVLIEAFIIITTMTKKTDIPDQSNGTSKISSSANPSNLFNLSNIPSFPSVVMVDATNDSRGIGYSGQRKIAYDDQGNIYAAYRKKYGRQYEIFVAKISNQAGLTVSGNSMPIANIQAANQRVPSIAVDSKGVVHVVWYGSDATGQENNRQIKYARSTDQGKSWSSWRNIAFVSGYQAKEIQWQEHPTLLVGKNDMLYVAWEGKDEQNGNQQIKFSKSDNGGNSWSSWKNVEIATGNTQSRPSMVEDKNGNVYLFAYSSEGNGFGDLQQIQYAVSSDKGDTWSPWQVISDPLVDSRHVSVAIDSKGIIHAVWRSGPLQGGPSQVSYRSFEKEQWGDIIAISQTSNYQFFPSIGVNDSGKAYVAWMENDDPSGFPREDPASGKGFVSFLKSGAFEKPISLGQNLDFYPNVPFWIDGAKQLPVMYLEQDKMNYSIKVEFLDVPK